MISFNKPENYAWVQTPIDTDDLEQGKRTAAMTAKNGAEWIEVGSSLLLKYGYPAIRELRSAAPDTILAADYKNPLAKNIIPEVADYGGDFITIEGCHYSDDVIRQFIEIGKKCGVGVIFSLITYHPDALLARAAHLESLGAEYLFIRSEVSADGVTRRFPHHRRSRFQARSRNTDTSHPARRQVRPDPRSRTSV